MIYTVCSQCLLFNLRLDPGKMARLHKFCTSSPFCDDIIQNSQPAICFNNWLHFHLWFISDLALIGLSIKCRFLANDAKRTKHLSVSIGGDLMSCSIVYCINMEGFREPAMVNGPKRHAQQSAQQTVSSQLPQSKTNTLVAFLPQPRLGLGGGSVRSRARSAEVK